MQVEIQPEVGGEYEGEPSAVLGVFLVHREEVRAHERTCPAVERVVQAVGRPKGGEAGRALAGPGEGGYGMRRVAPARWRPVRGRGSGSATMRRSGG
ncbi:hypothetical protein NKH18_21480 [Streptomyces sp. M10(2022)]